MTQHAAASPSVAASTAAAAAVPALAVAAGLGTGTAPAGYRTGPLAARPRQTPSPASPRPGPAFTVRPSLRSSRSRRRLRERRTLAFERLDRAVAPAVGQGMGHGIGEDVLLPVVDSIEDGPRDRLGEALGMSKPRVMSVSVGPVRTACTRTPCPASRARSDWVKLNAAALETA